MKKWYKLNNVGKFYASTTNIKIPKVFRYSAILEEDINEDILQCALNKTVEVYSNFNVHLKRGLFWYYLEETSKVNKVGRENLPICFKLYNNSDDYLYRVTYFKNKINFEVSHVLSDGRGSIEFFKLLVTNYINIKYDLGLETNDNNNSLLERVEDSFQKYYKKTKLPKTKLKNTYIYKGKKFKDQTRYMLCHLSCKEVKKLSHFYNTTITGLLVSVLLYSFKDVMNVSDLNKNITIDIPVDLRNYFKSNSSMNFFGMTTISYKFNTLDDTLDEIIESVNEQLKKNLTKEKLSERVNLMVSFEKNWFCRFAPIPVKDLVINIGQILTNNSTTSLSNVGIVKLKPEIEKRVESVSVLVSTTGFQFTVCSLKDDLCIGISSNYINNDIIKNFCRYFSLKDMKVTIDVSEVTQ